MFEFIVPTFAGDLALGLFDSVRVPLIAEESFGKSHRLNFQRTFSDGGDSSLDSIGIFFNAICGHINKVDPEGPVYAVIGVSADSTERYRLAISDVCRSIFEGHIIAPEPFLAALGLRDDSRLGIFEGYMLAPESSFAVLGFRNNSRLKSERYTDPVENSLIIDIGAETTRLCVMQGRYPTDKDASSLSVAGDWIDEQILNRLTSQYSGIEIGIEDARRIKEEHATAQKKLSASTEVMIKGRKTLIDVSDALSESISRLLDYLFEAIIRMIESSPARVAKILVKNIILTGGGSQIRYLDRALEERFAEYGIGSAECRSVGREDRRLAGSGAYKLAVSASRERWTSCF